MDLIKIFLSIFGILISYAMLIASGFFIMICGWGVTPKSWTIIIVGTILSWIFAIIPSLILSANKKS